MMMIINRIKKRIKVKKDDGEVDVKRITKGGEGGKEVDAWVGEKSFWNRKKGAKFVLTLSDPKLAGDEIVGTLSVENKSRGIRNKNLTAWLKVKRIQDAKKGKKIPLTKTSKKQKMKGTGELLADSFDVKVKVPDLAKGEICECLMHLQADFKGVHANMAMVVDLTEFIPADKMSKEPKPVKKVKTKKEKKKKEPKKEGGD